MQAICGYVRLDHAPIPAGSLARLARGLCPNPASAPRHHAYCAGAAALGFSHWDNLRAERAPALLHYADSGCTVVADARLDECTALARRLGVRNPVDPPGAARLILQAWQRWGEDCAERLYGDFAFAIWDARRHLLYLARDILGVRPLHVHYQPGRLLAFATRAAALPALPEVPDHPDPGRIADALVPQLEGIDKTSTFFCHVQRLPPAHWASFTAQGRRQACYWQPQPGKIALPTSDADWTQAFASALETAVRRHLEGAQTLGAMLSGGLDSSSLATVAADQLAAAGRSPLATFSSVDDDPACAETRAIHAMWRHPGLQPHAVDPQAFDAMRAELLQATRQADEPFDGSMTLLHVQYRTARQADIDALIDGIDADTLLAQGSALVRQLQHGHWLAAWRNIHGLQQTYPSLTAAGQWWSAARAAFIPEAVRRRVRRDRLESQTRAALGSSLIAPDFAVRVRLRERLERLNAWFSRAQHGGTAPEAAQALANPYTTCGLERYHRVAAWHGVQPRHPFADRDLLELCVNLPDAQRLHNGWTKPVLRHAMHGRLPNAVCWRRGKEHLGWKLSKRLFLGNEAAVREELTAHRATLAPWVDLARLDAAVARAWQGSACDETLERVFNVVCLGRWLRRLTGAAGVHHDETAPGPGLGPCASAGFE